MIAYIIIQSLFSKRVGLGLVQVGLAGLPIILLSLFMHIIGTQMH